MTLELQISKNFTARFQFEQRNLTKNQREPNKIMRPLHCVRKTKKHNKQIKKSSQHKKIYMKYNNYTLIFL